MTNIAWTHVPEGDLYSAEVGGMRLTIFALRGKYLVDIMDLSGEMRTLMMPIWCKTLDGAKACAEKWAGVLMNARAAA